MMSEPDAEGTRRVAVMNGDFGEEAQYALIRERSLELIGLAFDFFTFVPAAGAAVRGSNQEPFIESRD